MDYLKNLDVVALGGNAILPAGKVGTIDEQIAITHSAMEKIADLLQDGRSVVLTHGNGPIVGNIVLRNEALRDQIPPMPLDVCGADSQGGIGYMIQQTLRNALARRDIEREVASVVTQVVVDPQDPAFKRPTKPIGPYYTEEQARRLEADRGWTLESDSNRGGYRRMVPSPRPVEIVEIGVVRALVAAGVVVVTVGGGGIPVTRTEHGFRGCEAVVDKDLASSLLARELGAERLIILTDVDAVYQDFGSDRARPLPSLGSSEIKELMAQGVFPMGSMGSKLAAAIEFLESGGKSVVICRPEQLIEAARGRKGTTIKA